MKIKDGRKTITTDIAYIAGFMDGEGCIRIKKANQGGSSYYIWVAITNSNKFILEYIQNLFGGSIRKAEKTVNKDVYHLLITSSEATDMLKVLNLFLIEKKPQADLAIKFHNEKESMTLEQKIEAVNLITAMKKSPELLKETK